VIAKAGVRSFIKKMNARGTTFILTTHDLEDVEQLAEQTIIINHGSKIFDDSLSNLRKQVGDKKQISLTLHNAPSKKSLEGMRVTSSPTDLELTLEADTTNISEFMESLFRRFNIRDISVKEQPIEDIISVLYARNAP
jgi:ABC-2 type transport system ATP-binding protein